MSKNLSKTISNYIGRIKSNVENSLENFGVRRNFYKNLIISVPLLGGTISPAFVQGTEFYSNSLKETAIYSNAKKDSVSNKTYQSKKEDFSKDFIKGERYFHITPEGDTIVSSLTKEKDLEKTLKGTMDYSQYPMFGLNEYVPAYDSLFQTNTNWYGSGDVNNNGLIDWEDYNSTISGNNPWTDGTYRFDTDLNGVSGTLADKQIIYEYLTGIRNHINKWEFESYSEKVSHFQKAITIDPTDQINPYSSGWLCGNYAAQTFLNFNGVYNPENSVFGEDNGTNLQYDVMHNGIIRIPLREVHTMTSEGIAHEINSIYLGSPENQDATDFYNRIFIEPQTDEFIEIGNYSLNDFANENWYGYYFNIPFQQWWYSTRSMVNYNFSGGQPNLVSQNPNLVISWTPFEQIQNPENISLEFPADTNSQFTGLPDSLYYGTDYSYSDLSNQTSNQTCSDVTYEILRAFNYSAGAYNSSNTPSATYTQTINVHDLTPPEFSYFPSDTLITKYDSMSPQYLGFPQAIDNSNLPINFSYSDELLSGDDPFQYWARHWNAVDVCGNEADSTQYITVDLMDKLKENKSLESILIYPNPTNGKINLNYSFQKGKNISFEVFDLSGKSLEEFTPNAINIFSDVQEFQLDLSKYANGIYFIRTNVDGNPSETSKIIKQ